MDELSPHITQIPAIHLQTFHHALSFRAVQRSLKFKISLINLYDPTNFTELVKITQFQQVYKWM